MAIVKGDYPPADGDTLSPDLRAALGYDHNLPIASQRFSIPLAGTNQAGSGVLFSDTEQIEWDIRGVIIVNRSTKRLLLKYGYSEALNDLQVSTDIQVEAFKVWSFPVRKKGIQTITYAITGPTTTQQGDIDIIAVPVFLQPMVADIQPNSGQANSVEPYSNAAFANNGDTGATAFLNNITSVVLCADNEPMNFYLGEDTSHMTGPIPVLAGEKFSLAGTFGAYRVTNTSGSNGGYRIIGSYSQ